MALGLGEPSKLTKYKRKIAAPLQTKESRKLADDELIFSLEEEHISDLSQTQSLTFPATSSSTSTSSVAAAGGHQFSQSGSLKLKGKSPIRQTPRFNSVRLSRHVKLNHFLNMLYMVFSNSHTIHLRLFLFSAFFFFCFAFILI